MPEVISTEQVRADEIKLGDLIWWDGVWRQIPLAVQPYHLVLRRTAPASPLVGQREQLDEMRLHEDTGDPSDEGYMKAIREVDEWLASQENTGAADVG